MADTFKRGDDFQVTDDSLTTYGIHVGDHGNGIEVHGNAELRDRVLELLQRDTTTDLNQLSDEALRLALARALERNAHLESLVASIGERVKGLDRYTPEWMSAERFASMCDEYDTVEAYLDDQSWVLEQRADQEEGEDPYPYDHECPFFSERFLYSILGKDDARTVLALFNQIERLATEDDLEMDRRRKRREEILRYAGYVMRVHRRIEDLQKYLDPEYSYRPKVDGVPATDEYLEAELAKAKDDMVKTAERLGAELTWHREDW